LEDSPIEVLCQPKQNEISLIAADDSTGEQVETTLNPAQAWALVTALNSAILKLTKNTVVSQHPTPKRARKAIQAAEPVAVPVTKGPDVQGAVLASLDMHQPRPRHVPPGPPASIAIKGFRTYEDPSRDT